MASKDEMCVKSVPVGGYQAATHKVCLLLLGFPVPCGLLALGMFPQPGSRSFPERVFSLVTRIIPTTYPKR